MNLNKNCCIAVFGYNRPSHLRRLLIALENHNLREIYFFLDGPKNKLDKINQREILIMTKKNPFIKINVLKAKKNQGLKISVERGLKKLSKKYKFAIIFEDDCVPRKEFFEFIKLNLKLLNTKKFAAICGYLYNPIHKKFLIKEETFTTEFSNFCPWGYCIDLGVWKNYLKTQNEINKFKNLKNKLLIKIKKISNSKKIWTLGFMTFCKINKYNFIYPSRSLIKNIGFDGSGQNSKITNKFDTEYRKSKITNKFLPFSNHLNDIHEKFLTNNIKYFY